jgi:hypothetical protein
MAIRWSREDARRFVPERRTPAVARHVMGVTSASFLRFFR